MTYSVTLTNIRDDDDTVQGNGETLAEAVTAAVADWYYARPGYKETGNKPPAFTVTEIEVAPG